MAEERRRVIRLDPKGAKLYKFEFKSYQLALQVRELFYDTIIAFDVNEDLQFSEEEIKAFLVDVLHESITQIPYFVNNIFRYDYNGDGVIEYDELVNFCMEQHFGEIALQRLHRQQTYKRGGQRLMDEGEFLKTVQYSLSFIKYAPSLEAVGQLFGEIDLDRDGLISYEDYFRFLKEYFGSKSYAARLISKQSVLETKRTGSPERDLLKKYSKYDETGQAVKGGEPGAMGGSLLNERRSGRQSHAGSKIEVTMKSRKERPDPALVAQVGERVSRLVRTQLAVILSEFDADKDVFLSGRELWNYLATTYRHGPNQQGEVMRRYGLAFEKRYSYEEGVRMVLTEHIKCVLQVRREEYGQDEFVHLLETYCRIVPFTPVVGKLEVLFQAHAEGGKVKGEAVERIIRGVFVPQ